MTETEHAACRYPKEAPNPIPELRADFVRRLFAVAVSVGFAAHIKTLTWLPSLPDLPPQHVLREAFLLVVALIAVVVSWEGYLKSLKRHPLVDQARFYVDIVLVFEYLILMYLYDTPTKFLIWMTWIFSAYTLWDYLRIIANKSDYGVTNGFNALFPFFRGLFSGNYLYKGPSVTLWWLLYFIALQKVGLFDAWPAFLITGTSILYGVILYRVDKNKRWGIGKKVLVATPPLVLLACIPFFVIRS